MKSDYGVIGGGPGGYTVAMKLAQKGHKVVLFEKAQIGGTCLNKGCIPTKSMLHSSEIYKNIINSTKIGVELDIQSFDYKKVIAKRDETVEKIRKALELSIKKSGVKIVYEEAKIVDSTTIIADEEYKVDQIIVATGSRPKELKGLEFDGDFILSSDDVLRLDKLPHKVLIVGSGAIGTEWARIFSNFEVEVSIVEMAEHLVPAADIDVSKRVERLFRQQKIKFYLKDKVEKVDNKIVTLSSGVQIEPDFILVAVGRTPLKPDITDCTIIGDACGEIQLAHYAIHQGMNFAGNKPLSDNKDLIPSVIYGEPEIAWVGKREQDCSDDCSKVIYPITALGKSWCDDAIDGFIKIITQNDLIVGASIISKEASSLIHQLLIAIEQKIPIDELKNICFAHPTYSEGILESLYQLS